MLINQLAHTYATAICQIAKEKSMLDEVETQLKGIDEVISTNADLSKLLYHPRVPAKVKKETVTAIFGEDLDQFVLNFLLLLIDKRRETAFTAIVKEYVVLANEIRNIALAEVTAAKELNASQQQALIDKLKKITGKNIVLKINYDETILGGVIVKIGDKLIDGSVARQLKVLKSKLLAQKLTAG